MGRHKEKGLKELFDKLFPEILKRVQSGETLKEALKNTGTTKYAFYEFISKKQLLEINQNKAQRLTHAVKRLRKHYLEDLQNLDFEDEQ